MIVSLVLMHTILGRLPLEQVGLRLRLGTPEILLLIAAMAPLCLLAPAIQTYFSCSAKSFKEAQSYSVFFVLPIVFLGMVSMFYPVTGQPWLVAVPFLSQYSLAAGVLAGRAVSGLALITAGVMAAALATLFLWLAGRRFSTEKIIFGR
jgi:sodium transport system permease protein